MKLRIFSKKRASRRGQPPRSTKMLIWHLLLQCVSRRFTLGKAAASGQLNSKRETAAVRMQRIRTRPRVSRFVPQKVTRKAIRKQYVMSVLISRAHCLLQPRARQLPQENSLKICRQRLPSALALHLLFKRWHAICTPSAHFVTFCTLPQSGQRTLPESRCFCPRSPVS